MTVTTTAPLLIDASPVYVLAPEPTPTAGTLQLSDGTAVDLGEWLLILIQLAAHNPALALSHMATAEHMLGVIEANLDPKGGDAG